MALQPLVHLVFRVPPGNKAAELRISTPVHPPSNPDYPDMKIEQPFPTTSEFLTWPMIVNIVDGEIPPEDVQTRFEDIRSEFDRVVVEWKNKIERDLIEVWRAGLDGD